jgi:hypothetical protein
MKTVDNTANVRATLSESAAEDVRETEVAETPASAAAVTTPATEAGDPVEAASEGLKTALEQTRQAASKAGKSGGNAGVARLVEAVVSLVSSLVSLISSFLPLKKEQTQGGGSASPGTSSGSGSPTTGSGASPSASPSSSAGTSPASPATSSPAAKAGLQALTDEKGVVTVRTPDGFQLKAEGREQAWQIIGPEGRATRIWGDPHVNESDGGKWDFKEQSSFVFGANKVTVETSPAGNGQTLSRRITLYHGSERVTIAGIDTNKPFLVGLAQDGKQHDDSLSDGTTYRRGLGKKGEAWSMKSGGKNKVMAGS